MNIKDCLNKEYLVVQENDSHPTIYETTLVWDKTYQAYFLKESGWKNYKIKYIDADGYLKLQAHQYKEIFPEYEEGKHCCFALGGYHHGWMLAGGILVCLHQFDAVQKIDTIIKPGIYNIVKLNDQMALKPTTVNLDSHIDIKEEKTQQQIYSEMLKFQQSQELYKKEGVRFKQGALLYGPPGNGKSHEICQIIANAEKNNVIVIQVSSNISIGLLDMFRKPLEKQFTVLIFEELTERLSPQGDSLETVLSFLDGELSWENCFVIATTNYPEELPYNVIDRPGRFGLIIEFPNPTINEKIKYLKGRGYNDEESVRIANLTEGLSLDYLVQGITYSKVYGETLESYLKKAIDTRKKVQSKFKDKIGFERNSELGDALKDKAYPSNESPSINPYKRKIGF